MNKTTPLPSVEEEYKDFLDEDGNYYLDPQDLRDLLTQDRNQAYTSLVEGIEGMKKVFVPADVVQVGGLESNEWKFVPKEDGMYCLNCERFTPKEGCMCGMASLTDILENVVKPLYGKE